MYRLVVFVFMAAFLMPLTSLKQVEAGSRDKVHSKYSKSSSKSKKVRKSRKVGGYSFTYKDVLTPVPLPERGMGPFDSGFWFDSGSHGPINNSPYHN